MENLFWTTVVGDEIWIETITENRTGIWTLCAECCFDYNYGGGWSLTRTYNGYRKPFGAMERAQGTVCGYGGGYYWCIVDRLPPGFHAGRCVANTICILFRHVRKETCYFWKELLWGRSDPYNVARTSVQVCNGRDPIRKLGKEHHQALAMLTEKEEELQVSKPYSTLKETNKEGMRLWACSERCMLSLW